MALVFFKLCFRLCLSILSTIAAKSNNITIAVSYFCCCCFYTVVVLEIPCQKFAFNVHSAESIQPRSALESQAALRKDKVQCKFKLGYLHALDVG